MIWITREHLLCLNTSAKFVWKVLKQWFWILITTHFLSQLVKVLKSLIHWEWCFLVSSYLSPIIVHPGKFLLFCQMLFKVPDSVNLHFQSTIFSVDFVSCFRHSTIIWFFSSSQNPLIYWLASTKLLIRPEWVAS